MTTKDFDNQSEEKLTQFLKNNSPLVPPAQFDEKEKVLRAMMQAHIEAKPKKQSTLFSFRKWFIPVATAAVLVFAVWLRQPEPTIPTSSDNIEEYLQETVGALYSLNGEDLIGENYLYLAEIVSQL